MSVENKYLIYCWGSIILFFVLFITIAITGQLFSGITIILMLLSITLCVSACIVGNKPDEELVLVNQH